MKQALIFSLTFFAILSLKAQSDTLYLTHDRALEMALKSNPTISIARLEKARAEANLSQNRGNLLPSLNASGAYTRNLKKQVIFFPEEMAPLFGGVTALEVGNDNSYMGGFQFAMPLYNPAIYAGIDAARKELNIAHENFRSQTIELSFNVQNAWYNLLLAKESKEIIQYSYDNALDNLENIRRISNQGLATEYDLIRAEVQTQNLKPQLLQAQNQYELSLNFLKVLLGIDAQTPVSTTETLTISSEKMLSEFNILSAQKSLNNNPDYIRLGLQKDLILLQSKSLKATVLPSVTAVSNYMYLSEANDFKFSDYNWVNTASAGLQVSIPLFRGFTNRNQVKQLEIGAQQLQLQREYLQENLSVELSSVLENMKVALEKAASARQNVDLAQRGYEIARLRFDTGQGTQLEINDSDMALRNARFNLLVAKHELLMARIQYDRLLGETALPTKNN